jgi:hypothetical protein
MEFVDCRYCSAFCPFTAAFKCHPNAKHLPILSYSICWRRQSSGMTHNLIWYKLFSSSCTPIRLHGIPEDNILHAYSLENLTAHLTHTRYIFLCYHVTTCFDCSSLRLLRHFACMKNSKVQTFSVNLLGTKRFLNTI